MHHLGQSENDAIVIHDSDSSDGENAAAEDGDNTFGDLMALWHIVGKCPSIDRLKAESSRNALKEAAQGPYKVPEGAGGKMDDG